MHELTSAKDLTIELPFPFLFQEVYQIFQAASLDLGISLHDIREQMEHRIATVEAQTPNIIYMCKFHDKFDQQLLLQIRNKTNAIK